MIRVVVKHVASYSMLTRVTNCAFAFSVNSTVDVGRCVNLLDAKGSRKWRLSLDHLPFFTELSLSHVAREADAP